MSNKCIPYFYIIENIHNGMYYAGAKWGDDANPNNFMTENGYKTSSSFVKHVIEKDGLLSFRIKRLKVFNNKEDARRYETAFLKKVNAKANPRFYNCHNNDFKDIDFLIAKFGVDNVFQLPEIKEKIKSTNIEKYGKDNYSKTKEFKDKYKATMLEKYGVENAFQSEKIKNKIRETNKERYGVDHYSQSEEGRKKISERAKELGVGTWNKGIAKSEETKNKMSSSASSRERLNCEKCNQGYTKANFNKHFVSCNGKIQLMYKKHEDGKVRRILNNE